MRIFPIITALLVTAGLFVVVFQRDMLFSAAHVESDSTALIEKDMKDVDPPASVMPASTMPASVLNELPEADGAKNAAASVVAIHSQAQNIEMPILLRGRTEANRKVELRAETSGLVISIKSPKGSLINEGDILCKLDPGTRESKLAETRARLAEAKARVPEAEARVIEAQARLDEAEINLNAATKLSKGGFASDTRVLNAKASVETARAGVIAAQSGALSSSAVIQSAQASVAGALREIERLDIRAPFPGTLETESAETGSLLQPGAICATLVQYDPIRIIGFVSELLVDQIATGQTAKIKLASGRALSGKVTFVGATADPVTRTFRVDVKVDQTPNTDLVRAGQTAEVVISGNQLAAHLVPQSALTLNDEGALGVRIVNTDKTAGFAAANLVRDSLEGAWITGLAPQTDVIIVGHHYVTNGVSLAVTYQERAQ